MWVLLIYGVIVVLLVYLTAATAYLLWLAMAYFVVREQMNSISSELNRFAILVPAHNEELLIAQLCESLLKIDYPHDSREIFIVADNCSDRTAEICSAYEVCVLPRSDLSLTGKGYAIHWALERISLETFDAVLMVDADNIVDASILKELNQFINRGELAIQCHNAVENRNDSWFTQLLFVSRTIGNLLYHHSKHKLGLSSYLMGNGLCFKASLLQDRGWTAFTIGEDWEYYAQLIEDGIKIDFAVNAKVYHQESRSLNQATTQRLRWASGRFEVVRRLGLRLLIKGLRSRDWFTVDASLPLIFPNYSLQINLTLLTLILCCLIPPSAFKTSMIGLCLCLCLGLTALFLMGVCLTGGYWRVFKACLCAPIFLVWKFLIDFVSISGIYKNRRWIRTQRHLTIKK